MVTNVRVIAVEKRAGIGSMKIMLGNGLSLPVVLGD
jgi:hypothetical protein